ncbi:uncharacterized protein [Battus philenor]|uniref:uncharacterized protein n=1 Tax=Battus philenor TaxID=42288 RepID=UPI0035CF5621
MLYLAFCSYLLVSCVSAAYNVRCANSSETGASLQPSSDGVQGRYTLLWCTEADQNVTEWDLFVQFYESRKPEKCQHYDLKHPPPLGRRHSHIRQDVHIGSNCTNVCFSTSLDLIFKACYAVKSTLFRGLRSSESHDSFHYITNNFTTFKDLQASVPAVKIFNYDDYVKATWFLGPVPAGSFSMYICRRNTTLPQEMCMEVTENCTRGLYEISCQLQLPHGLYSIQLVHQAPWVYGRVVDESADYEFKHFGLAVVEVPVSTGDEVGVGAARWAAVGAGAALVLAAASTLLRRRARQKSRAQPTSETEAPEGAEGGAGIRVLLLYARDCARLTHTARCLAALLQRVAPSRVYDLYSAEVCAQAAGAPAEWVRALVARPDARVVLLQTPAAACLYASQLRQRGHALALEQPLLGGRVLPRSPHCSDALLQLALRLMCEGAARAAYAPDCYPYRKYFVAEITGIEADMVPLVTPQRRYALPAATELLLRDLAADTDVQLQREDLEEPLQQFSQSVEELLDYVRKNPDYLNDELLFL